MNIRILWNHVLFIWNIRIKSVNAAYRNRRACEGTHVVSSTPRTV